MISAFVGVDIGLNGGIACILDGSPMPALFEMPTLTFETKKKSKVTGLPLTRRELDAARVRSIFAQLMTQASEVYVMIERPQMRPAFTMGGATCPACHQPKIEKGQGLASQAKFLGQFERIAGLLMGLGVPFEDVHPATWKADVFHGRTEKIDARILASQLYPVVRDKLSLKKNDGLAEALLLADYGKRRRGAAF